MRIAVLFGHNSIKAFGGAERRLTRVYNEICAENDDLKCDIVVRGCDLDTALELFRQTDCDVSRINNVYTFNNRFKYLLHILFVRKYNLVHFGGEGRLKILVQLAYKLINKKTIYTIWGYSIAYNRLPKNKMRMVKILLRLADHVDLLYPAGADFISQYVKKENLSITPGTFTDLDVFKPQKKNKTIVYAAARLEDAKNPILFIESINECRDEIRTAGYKVVLLGQGKYEGHLHNYVKEKELTDIVCLTGYDRTSKFMPTASVFFSTQKLENYPSQSLAEAAACGCYLIITDVGDSRRCADKSFAAFVKAEPKALSQALVKYIDFSQEEKEAIIANARAFAEENYSIEKSKKYYAEILKKYKRIGV